MKQLVVLVVVLMKAKEVQMERQRENTTRILKSINVKYELIIEYSFFDFVTEEAVWHPHYSREKTVSEWSFCDLTTIEV